MRFSALLFLFISHFCIAQNKAPLVKQWDARFGGSDNDEMHSLFQTRDGGYILGGWSYSPAGGDKTQGTWGNSYDYWVVKIDSLGSKKWDHVYGGTNQDLLKSIRQTSDGGYMLAGDSWSAANGDKSEPSRGVGDYWILKIDSAGIKQWDKRYGGTGADVLFSLDLTADGGYIMGGHSWSDSSGDKSKHLKDGGGHCDYWIVKTDSAGNKEWDRDFGGIGENSFFSMVQQTSDRGYILGGFSKAGAGGDKSENNWDMTLATWDYWVIKTDSLGTKQWDHRYGGTDDDLLFYVHQTRDGGYILGGYSESGTGGNKTQNSRSLKDTSDFWVVKINAQGDRQWDRVFGGSYIEDEFGYVRETTDGGYLIGGASYSNISGDKTENNLGQEQSWIIKTDSLGIRQWDKTIVTRGHDEGGYAIQTSDGGYAIANYSPGDTGGYKTQMCRGGNDYWIIKFSDTSQHCSLASPNIIADRDTFCSGDSTGICVPSGFNSYQWNVGGSSKCIDAKQSGNYYVTVSDANNCTAESNHITISVYPVASVAVVVFGDTLESFGAMHYQWYKDGLPIDNAIASVYIAHEQGAYSVAVTDSNGCEAVSNPIIYTGIDEPEGESVMIYPNPFSMNNVQISITNGLLGSKLEIYDDNGRLVFFSKLSTQSSQLELPLSRGVYLIRIRSDKASLVKKIIRL